MTKQQLQQVFITSAVAAVASTLVGATVAYFMKRGSKEKERELIQCEQLVAQQQQTLAQWQRMMGMRT